jgi:TolB-like protein/Flp pilus assembly protein TadD
LAVLPLLNLSKDPEQEYLVEGMTDELITDLARLGSVRVISHTSVRPYKDTRRTLSEIARALNVDAIVEGSVFRSDRRVRITAQLLDTRGDRHLWAETYDRTLGDLLEVQREVTHAISTQIAAILVPSGPAPATPARAIKPEAWDNFLRGRYFWSRRTLDDLQKSIRYYRKAIELDPDYAEAYAELGQSYVVLSFYGGPPPAQAYSLARDAALKALQLDPNLPQAHTVLAAVQSGSDWNWKGAEAEYRRAIEISPGYSTAHHWYSLHLSRMGRRQDAKAEIDRALELDPLSLIVNADAGETYYWAREPDQAIARVQKALELDSNFAEGYAVLGKAYEQKGRFREAIAQFETAARLSGGNPKMLALRAHGLAVAGRVTEAEQAVRELEAMAKRRYVAGLDIAFVHCALGQRQTAMRWLQTAWQNREEGINVLAVEPLFDGCRQDPAFAELLRRVGFD